jgi:hypothetical protein
MPYEIELPDGRIVADIPDELSPPDAKKRILQGMPELAIYDAGQQMEKGSLDSWWQTLKGSVQGAYPTMRAGAAGMIGNLISSPSEYGVVAARALETNEDPEMLSQRYYGKPLAKLRLEDQAREYTQQGMREETIRQQVEARNLLPKDMTGGQEVLAAVGSNVSQNAPAILMALTGQPWMGAMYAAGLAGLDTMAQGTAEGADPERTRLAAAETAITEAVFERLGFGVLNRALASRTAPLWKKLGALVLGEEATELPTTAIQNVVTNLAFRPDMPWTGEPGSPYSISESLTKDLIMTAITTPFTAGLQYGMGRGLQRIKSRIEGKEKVEGEAEIPESVREILFGLAKQDQEAKALQQLAQMGILKGDQYKGAAEKIIAETEAILAKAEGIEELGGITPGNPPQVPTAPDPNETVTVAEDVTGQEEIVEVPPEQIAAVEAAAYEAAAVAQKALPPAFEAQLTEVKHIPIFPSGERALTQARREEERAWRVEELERLRAIPEDQRTPNDREQLQINEEYIADIDRAEAEDRALFAELNPRLSAEDTRIGPATSTLQVEPAPAPLIPLTSLEQAADAKIAKVDPISNAPAPDLQLSPKATRNLARYTNPNNGKALSRLPISWSSRKALKGPVRLSAMRDGDVLAAGVDSEIFTPALIKAIGSYVKFMNNKFMGGKGKFVIVLKSPTEAKKRTPSWHTMVGDVHIIQPPHGLRADVGGTLATGREMGEYNTVRQAQIFLSTAHEIGHALMWEQFYTRMPPDVIDYLENNTNSEELVPPEILDRITDPLARGVVEEYNALKQRMRNGGRGMDFLREWLSPGKANAAYLRSVGVAGERAEDVFSRLEGMEAKTFVTLADGKTKGAAQWWSFKEYFAEQLARYAYSTKGQRETTLGKFFGQIWGGLQEQLKAVFQWGKKTGIFRPGVKFQEWLESLTSVPAVEVAALAGKGDGLPPVIDEIRAEDELAVEVETRRAEEEAQAKEEELRQVTEKDLRKGLRAAGFAPQDDGYKMIIKLYKDGEIAEAITQYEMLVGKPFSYDTGEIEALNRFTTQFGIEVSETAGLTEAQAKDPKLRARAAELWRFMTVRSPFFKSWFGDWEGNWTGASVVVDANGRPAKVIASGQAVFFLEGGIITSRERALAANPNATMLPIVATTQQGVTALTALVPKTVSAPAAKKELARIVEREQALYARLTELSTRAATIAKLQASYVDTVLPVTVSGQLDTTQQEVQAWAQRYNDELKQIAAVEEHVNTELWNILTARNNILAQPSNYDPAHPLMFEAYVNVRNPATFPLGRMFSTAEIQDAIQFAMAQGHDGLLLSAANLGLDSSSSVVIPFTTNQVKSANNNFTYSRSPDFNYDFDPTTPIGMNAQDVTRAALAIKDSNYGWAHHRFIGLYRSVLQLQQLQQLNPDIVGLQNLVTLGREYHRDSSALLEVAEEAAQKVRSLGKEQRGLLWKAMLREAKEGKLWPKIELTAGGEATTQAHARLVGVPAFAAAVKYKYVVSETLLQQMKDSGLDPTTRRGEQAVEAYLAMKNAMYFQQQFLSHVLITQVVAKHSRSSWEEQVAAAQQVAQRFLALAETPFVPQMWFGKYVLKVKAKITDAEGKVRKQVVQKYAFEDRVEWKEKAEDLQRKLRPGEELISEEVREKHQVLMVLPLEFLEDAARELQLTSEDVAILSDLMQPTKVDKALARYDTKHLQIAGASEDIDRVFAAFSWHQTNYAVKMKYRRLMRAASSSVDKQRTILEGVIAMDPGLRWGHSRRMLEARKAMDTAQEYLMSPEQEYANFRAWVSTLYLSFNVKTALLNLYGTITTFSSLTTELGTVRGSAEFIKAVVQTATSVYEGWKGSRTGLSKAIDRGIKEGILSQSYAYMLAGQAIGGYWQRLFSRAGTQADAYLGSEKMSWYMGMGGRSVLMLGMGPFRIMELASRRLTFIGKYNQYMREHKLAESGTVNDEAYAFAVRSVEELQSDYGRLNKAPIFRGGGPLGALVPTGTIFLSFPQHMAFHSFGGYELGRRRLARLQGKTPRTWFMGYTTRLWLITALVAGIKGLPGFENLFDLLNALWRQLFGKTAEQELREFLREVHRVNMPVLSWLLPKDPNSVLYGAGRDVGGFDISRSVGFGRILPGTDALVKQGDSAAAIIGNTATSLMGPTGSAVYWLVRYMHDPSYANFAKIPGGAGAVMQAIDWHYNGARGPQGNELTIDLDSGKVRPLTTGEKWGRAAGFRPTVVSQNQERMFEMWDTKMYWQHRRRDIFKLYGDAYIKDDREAKADAKKALEEYNLDVPKEFPELRIGGKELSRNVKARRLRAKQLERGITPERRYRRVLGEVSESFEPAEEEEEE